LNLFFDYLFSEESGLHPFNTKCRMQSGRIRHPTLIVNCLNCPFSLHRNKKYSIWGTRAHAQVGIALQIAGSG